MLSNPIILSLILTLVLMGFHLCAPYLRRIPFIPEKCITSFSGGFAVTFVFLHMLPGLAEHKETIGSLVSKEMAVTPLLDLTVYVVGLIGFLVFFGLEKLAQNKHAQSKKMTSSDFYLHLAIFAIYNGLITYTLPLRVEAGLAFSLVFTLAIGLHFVIGDRSFEEHWKNNFYLKGRIILLGVLIVAWGLAVLTEPNAIVVAFMTSFLGGAILLNVFRNEIPGQAKSHFAYFVIGACFGTILLTLVTFLESPH